jgi:hypothetical protein
MRHSDDSNQFFVARLRNRFAARQEQPEPIPAKDGIAVREHNSMVELTEEDQRLLMALRERHEMYKERSQTLPALVEEASDDTAYDTIRVKQVIVKEI